MIAAYPVLGGTWPKAAVEVVVPRNELGVSQCCWCPPLANGDDWARWRDPSTGARGLLCLRCQRTVTEWGKRG